MLSVPRQDSGPLFSPRNATSEESLLLSQSTEGFLGDVVQTAREHIFGPTKTMLDIAKKRSAHMTDADLLKLRICSCRFCGFFIFFCFF